MLISKRVHLALLLCLSLSCAPHSTIATNFKPQEKPGASGSPTVVPERDWTEHLIPLPKQVEVKGGTRMPCTAIYLVLPAVATELDRAGAEELRSAIKQKCGVEVSVGKGKADPGILTIQLDHDQRYSADFDKHPNVDQAYRIDSSKNSTGSIVLIQCHATTDTGDYYALKTIRQLLVPSIEGRAETASVLVPEVRILDWPDLADRGEWGGNSAEDLEWMADRKLNLLEIHAKLTVDADRAHASLDNQLLSRAARHAIKVVPIINHLEQLENTGLFKVHPELKAIGVEDSICFSRPEIVKVLSEWLMDIGDASSLREVTIWLSEEGRGCKCAECIKNNRYVNEVSVCEKALAVVRRKYPKMSLRLLMTQGSYESNEKILSVLPAGTKAFYYHAQLTYDTSRRPMIYPVLEKFAKSGRWLGVYATWGASWSVYGPFSNPQFIHYRLAEFADKELSGVVGYTVPCNWLYPVNVEAAAEWSWNAHGRTPPQFSVSFAARHGIPHPYKFANWAEQLSQVSWDIFESRFPLLEKYTPEGEQAASGMVKLKLGTSIFESFKTAARFDQDLERCDKALEIARDLGEHEVEETLILKAYVQMLKTFWELGQVFTGERGIRPEDRNAAESLFKTYRDASEVLQIHYPRWIKASAQLSGIPGEVHQFYSTTDLLEVVDRRMGAFMEKWGFSDVGKPYRNTVLGSWKPETFSSSEEVELRIPLESQVNTAGTYYFQPRYKAGSQGISVQQVDLISVPKDNPASGVEESSDKHAGQIGANSKGDVYTLNLKEFVPGRSYVIVARIRGKGNTNGDFLFRKQRPEGN